MSSCVLYGRTVVTVFHKNLHFFDSIYWKTFKKKREGLVAHEHKNDMIHVCLFRGLGIQQKKNNIGEAHMVHSCRTFGKPAVAVISGHDYQHGGDTTLWK